MAEPTPREAKKLSGLEESLRALLSNRHGYGFQYSVTRSVQALHKASQIPWCVTAEELPVQQGGKSTHIDAILELKAQLPLFMVCECKRVSPPFADWCFVRTPGETYDVRVEGVDAHTLSQKSHRVRPQLLWQAESRNVFNLGLPVKTTEPGDPCGATSEVLKDALAQVWRGTSGYVEFLCANPEVMQPIGDLRSAIVVPALFTTAQLWTTEVDISKADLASGKIPATDLTPVPWLWLKQAISTDVRHSIRLSSRRGMEPSVGAMLRDRYHRCTAIVSTAGEDPAAAIRGFLGAEMWANTFHPDA